MNLAHVSRGNDGAIPSLYNGLSGEGLNRRDCIRAQTPYLTSVKKSLVTPIQTCYTTSGQSTQTSSVQSICGSPETKLGSSSNSSNTKDSGLDSLDICGGCGVITVCLNDPLSRLISKIMGLREEEANAVGVYYEESKKETHRQSLMNVILFNIYDNEHVPWMRSGYTMDLLVSSPFVTKITYYPIVSSSDNASSFSSQSTFLSRSTMKSKPCDGRLGETFRTVVAQTIEINSKAVHDKNVSYTRLLLKAAGITAIKSRDCVTGEEADKLFDRNMTVISSRDWVTGYSLVNRVLLTLMGMDRGVPSGSIVPCPLLRRPISITETREVNKDSDVKYIVEESRREIKKLAEVFVDLFTAHEEFRSNVLAARNGKSLDRNSSLDELFLRETELVTHLVGGLQNGIISSATVNDCVRCLNTERFSLGNYQELPLAETHKSTVRVSDDTLMCTFKVADTLQDTDPLRDLGEHIQNIVDTFDTTDALVINLGGIIAAYNRAVNSTPNLKKIVIPELCSKMSRSSDGGLTAEKLHEGVTISRSAVVTIPGNTGGDVDIPVNSGPIAIPMYNANLTRLTDPQLMDILLYLDSLRDSDGTGDKRFCNLQNEVTHELALRRRQTCVSNG